MPKFTYEYSHVTPLLSVTSTFPTALPICQCDLDMPEQFGGIKTTLTEFSFLQRVKPESKCISMASLSVFIQAALKVFSASAKLF